MPACLAAQATGQLRVERVELRRRQARGQVEALTKGAVEFEPVGTTAQVDRGQGQGAALLAELLLEGAAGFGTSAALAAPFLMAIGMSPIAAVTAAMLGHVIGVTFGVDGSTLMDGGLPVIGATAEVEDTDGDGFAEVVELDTED